MNEACKSGNTALHAAVNRAKLELVEILLRCERVDVNRPNEKCMDVSALHLAVWNGLDEIAWRLASAGGDVHQCMCMADGSRVSALDLAKSNESLYELLVEFV